MNKLAVTVSRNEENNINKIVTLGNLFVGFLHENSSYLMELMYEIQNKRGVAKKRILDIALKLNNSLTQTRELINHSPNCVFSPIDEINSSIDTMNYQLKTNQIAISTNLSGIALKGYPVIFRQIIICLLLNAVDALKNKKGKRIININSYFANNSFFVEVTDNGEGFVASKKSKSTNTGLGLYFVTEALNKYFNGEIVITSKKELGTTCTIKIPQR